MSFKSRSYSFTSRIVCLTSSATSMLTISSRNSSSSYQDKAKLNFLQNFCPILKILSALLMEHLCSRLLLITWVAMRSSKLWLWGSNRTSIILPLISMVLIFWENYSKQCLTNYSFILLPKYNAILWAYARTGRQSVS